jgi:hypothetical protein
MEPYIKSFHEDVCADCAFRVTDQCPCPLGYLLLLAVEAIEAVDERQKAENRGVSPMVPWVVHGAASAVGC